MGSPAPQKDGDEDTKWWKNFLSIVLGLVTGGLALWTLALRPGLAAKAQDLRILSFGLTLLKVVGSGLILSGLSFFAFKIYKSVQSKLEESKTLRREKTLLQERLRWKDMDEAMAGMQRAKTMWSGKAPLDPTLSGYEDDPVYMQLSLDSGLSKILSQPIVQRLSHIRHLSFAYLTFRSATHTRLAHSLGACRNAEAVMTKIFRDRRVYTRNSDIPQDIKLNEDAKTGYLRLAMVAALLHDLGHGPLSHALDIHIGLGKRGGKTIKPDREFSRKYIGHYLRDVINEAGVDPDKVIALMQEDKVSLDGWLTFIGDLVDSPLDVDRMDYLARDAHMTGLSAGALNMEALIERIVPFKEVDNGITKIELAFDESAVPYIEQFLYARDVMYLNCYEHPKKVVAESMLGKAFDEFRRASSSATAIEVEDLALLSDQQIIELMFSTCGPESVVFRMLDLLMKGVTFRLVREFPVDLDLKTLNQLDPTALQRLSPEIGRWARAARKRDYQGAYIAIPDEWAGTLARNTGIEESKILVTVPSWSIVENWMKEGRIRVLQRAKEGGYTVEMVRDISSILGDFVSALTRARLKVRVFVDPDLGTEDESLVTREASSIFERQ